MDAANLLHNVVPLVAGVLDHVPTVRHGGDVAIGGQSLEIGIQEPTLVERHLHPFLIGFHILIGAGEGIDVHRLPCLGEAIVLPRAPLWTALVVFFGSAPVTVTPDAVTTFFFLPLGSATGASA
jgi:hypothetical protein